MNNKLKLFEENQNLIHWYAKKIGKQFDEDIKQILSIGLWKACCNYDPSKNIKFSTYATTIMFHEYSYTFRDKQLKLNIVDLTGSVEDFDNNECLENLVSDPAANIENILEYLDIKDLANEEIASWPDRDKNIYEDYYINEIPQYKLVEKYGVSQPQISRILRAVKGRLIKKLKKIVAEEYIDY